MRLLIPFVLLVVPAHADQAGVVVRQAKVYSEASSLSAQVGQFAAGTTVTVFERSGGWQQIHSDKHGVGGWVRVYQVRTGSYSTQAATIEEQEDSRGFLAGLASLSRKASGFFSQPSGATSSSTATIGVRGLSEVEINTAQADFDELKKMNKYASKPGRMEKFTAKGGLTASKVPYISGFKE